ncbi:hypothetical protein H4R26_001862 [Coemansia thaxteri]|uniref:Uncharacterized protein n=1 Tax=Coemansia thaxteri TaxID=2663907 RepID=A0A9W8EK36_9FUNG|nr:hypothetical protein H4R26_001862 [Coemansia thaxteri]KAJ2484589.1 hypothetical protein EV174_002320 [Coemansia sp. RSA 2320]
MRPEELALELEPGRVRRILRKLLAKLADLEEEVALRPSVYGSSRGGFGCSNDDSVFGSKHGLVPPAHPFEGRLAAHSKRPPRYTYKRRRCPSSSGNSSDGMEDEGVGAGDVPRCSQNSRARAQQLCRSTSLGSRSNSDMSSSGQDPALLLTTPRKRLKRRSSAGVSPEEQSFTERLETLIVRPGRVAVNTYKAKCLETHMAQLGEMLWLGRAAGDDAGQAVRALPLKVLAAFRLGEAIALSEDSSDLDYLDEMYSSIPAFLGRFVLWQHAVTLCYVRAPAYTDALSEALWQVGAFAQQDTLIGARIAGLQPPSALLVPHNIAPLHLRAADIGAEARFVDRLLQRLAVAGDAPESLLWIQFAPAALIARDSPAPSDDEGDAGPLRSTVGPGVPSRYAKWVARISDPAQSVRILAAAVEQALGVILASDSDVRAALAAKAARAACSIMYTKLGGAAAGQCDAAVGGLRRCIGLLARLTGVHSDRVEPGAHVSAHAATQAEVGAIGLQCQCALVFLTLRQLDAEPPSAAHAPLAAMARLLLRRIRDGTHAVPARAHGEPAPSRRLEIAARFDALLEARLSVPAGGPEPQLASRVVEAVVLPLALAGASPEALLDIARLAACALGRASVGRAIASAVAARLDAIWSRHRECCAWQRGWSRLQADASAGFGASADADAELLAKLAVQRQLAEFVAALDAQRAGAGASSKQRSASAAAASAPEDELGLMLARGRSRVRRVGVVRSRTSLPSS